MVATYFIVIIGTLIILIFEIITIVKLGLRSFISDFYNYADAASLIITSTILANDFFYIREIDDSWFSLLVACGVFVLCIKLFYWFRLFTGLSFYMRLIRETIYDMRFILIILIMMLIMFSLVIFAFNKSLPEGK